MLFLAPGVLWSLLALGIPVLIHLFNFQRTEKIWFANTRILTEVAQQTRRARNLKSWLLLAFRVLALAFLILAFAQPVFNRSGLDTTQAGLAQVAVYVDNSQSVTLQTDGQSPFNRVLETARSVPSVSGKKGWFRLFTNQFERRHVWTSAHGFEDQLTEINSSGNSRPFPVMNARMLREIKSQVLGDQRTAYYLSDFQKSGVGLLENIDLDSSVQHQFVVFPHGAMANVFVDSVWLPAPISLNQKSHSLSVRLRQSGGESTQPINLQLYAQSSLESGKTVSFSGQPALEVSLPFHIRANETKQCTLTINDALVKFDNQFFVTLKAPPPTQVMVLDEQENVFLKNLFSNRDLFTLNKGRFANIDFRLLKEAGLIVLNEPGEIDEALSESLQEKLKTGASLWIIPPPKPSPKLMGFLQKAGFSLEARGESGSKTASEWKIKVPSRQDPFYSGALEQVSPNVILPFARPVFDVKNGNFLLRYESGSAALVEQKWLGGRLFLQAHPFRDEVGNFHQHALVVPTAYKIAFSASPTATLPLYYPASAPFAWLPLPQGGYKRESAIRLVQGKTQWMANQQADGSRIRIELPGESMVPGFYQVMDETKTIGLVALNRDKSESEMEFYTAEDLRNHFKGKRYVSVNEVKPGDSGMHAVPGHDGISLWKYCILACLLMFAGEMWVARTRTGKDQRNK